MSIADNEGRAQRAEGSGDGGDLLPSGRSSLPSARKRVYASVAFVTLLILSVFWPSPIVSVNRLWLGERLSVDELSFLGREAPSWDVVFWCLAGILLLLILQTAGAGDAREPLRQLRAMRFDRGLWPRVVVGLAAGAIATTLAWLLLDAPLLAWAEGVQSDFTEDVIRIMNRLGGGMNPVLIVAFFLIAGVVYAQRRWVSYALAMALAGLGAGVAGQIVKQLVGRARPELWLGPSHYAPGSSTSFPSGHTVGAFALAGVLLFASRNWPLRVIALLLAIAVGLSRILAFRHWASDVTASAAVGLVAAWIAVRVIPLTKSSEPSP
jgi:membrane-associated phospholipid phosphatase